VARGWEPPHWSFDVYVLHPDTDAPAAPASVRVVEVEPVSGAVVAVRADSQRVEYGVARADGRPTS
jgi:hypothetical protein